MMTKKLFSSVLIGMLLFQLLPVFSEEEIGAGTEKSIPHLLPAVETLAPISTSSEAEKEEPFLLSGTPLSFSEAKEEETFSATLLPAPSMIEKVQPLEVPLQKGSDLPSLMITEVYFQGASERIEIYNPSAITFSGTFDINYGTKTNKKIFAKIEPQKTLLLSDNFVGFDETPGDIQNMTISLGDENAIAINLYFDGVVGESFFVDTGTVLMHNKGKVSFEKREKNGSLIIVPTPQTRTKYLQAGYQGNPGVAFDFDTNTPQDPIQPDPSTAELPQLIITEAFFDSTNAWIEVSNIGTGAYAGNILLQGIGKEHQLFTYEANIPAQSSFVFAKNERYFTGDFLKHITNDDYFLDRNSGLQLTLKYGSGQQDQLIVHPERTQFLKGKENSFEKVLLEGKWLTTRTTLDRKLNMRGTFIANPGIYFTQAENAKDISQAKNPPNLEHLGTELPIACADFTDRYRLELQELFRGNEVYQPFIELKRSDSPSNYSHLRFTGTLLNKELIIEKNPELRNINQTFLIGKDEFWNDKGIDSDAHSDFGLVNSSGYLMIEGLQGQSRQVLDIILLTGAVTGKSNYFGGSKLDCASIFSEIGDFSPGFDRKFLEFFKIDSKPKIEYITIGGGSGGNYSCPTKEDLCPAKLKSDEKKKTESVLVEEELANEKKLDNTQQHSDFDLSKYAVKIEDIDYNPPGADTNKESITLILTTGGSLDLSLLTLNINGKNKKIKGTLNEGISQTFIGNFGFPNTSKTSDTILVQLKHKEQVLDSYYYKLSSEKKEEKAREKLKEGIKVFSVLDGDTLRYRDEQGKLQSVRLLGVDSPESNTARFKKTECYGKEAKDYLTERLKGKSIQLSFDNDIPKTDRYGRLLAYVWLEEKLINEELISKGFAKEYTYKEVYQEQEKFQKAEKSAQSSQIGMRNSGNCPYALEQDLESRENAEQLVIKITALDYDPPGVDKENESITLSIFNKGEERKSIDFSNQFGLFIFEHTGTGIDFSFEDIEEGTGKKFKDLSFLGVQELENPLILKGNFQLPNTKSSCVALVQKEHLFDIACYDVEKKKPEEKKEENTDLLTGISLKILSLTPNPKGKDTGKEKIELLFESGEQEIQTLDLSSGFYLLINGKTKKKISGRLEAGKSKVLEGKFSFPNSSSCIRIGKGDQIFDTFCYGQTKDGITYRKNNEILNDFDSEELQIIKASKLVKQGNKHCISYRNQIFACRGIPNTRSEIEKTRKSKAQIWESAFAGLEELLREEYRPRYEQSKVNDYFRLAKKMKTDLKTELFTTKIGGHEYDRKLFPKIFEKKESLTLFDTASLFFKDTLSEKVLPLYEKKKAERLKRFPDEV